MTSFKRWQINKEMKNCSTDMFLVRWVGHSGRLRLAQWLEMMSRPQFESSYREMTEKVKNKVMLTAKVFELSW